MRGTADRAAGDRRATGSRVSPSEEGGGAPERLRLLRCPTPRRVVGEPAGALLRLGHLRALQPTNRSRRRRAYTAAAPSRIALAISTDTAVHDSASTVPPGKASLNELQCGSRCDADTPMAVGNPTATATRDHHATPEHFRRQHAGPATQVIGGVQRKTCGEEDRGRPEDPVPPTSAPRLGPRNHLSCHRPPHSPGQDAHSPT